MKIDAHLLYEYKFILNTIANCAIAFSIKFVNRFCENKFLKVKIVWFLRHYS